MDGLSQFFVDVYICRRPGDIIHIIVIIYFIPEICSSSPDDRTGTQKKNTYHILERG